MVKVPAFAGAKRMGDVTQLINRIATQTYASGEDPRIVSFEDRWRFCSGRLSGETV